MNPLVSLILPALIPLLSDGVRGLFNWFTGGAGAVPANVDEAIRLKQAETAQLEAIGRLDAPVGNISPWVADLRAAFRYVAAGIILIPLPFMALWAIMTPTDPTMQVIDLYVNAIAGPVFAFMFGDRLRLSFKKR